MGAEIQAVGGVAALEARGTPASRTTDAKGSEANQPNAPPARIAAQTEAAPGPDSVGLVFEVKPQNHQVVVKVVDRSTHKVIREIPPEELQRLQSAADDLVGLLVDHTG